MLAIRERERLQLSLISKVLKIITYMNNLIYLSLKIFKLIFFIIGFLFCTTLTALTSIGSIDATKN